MNDTTRLDQAYAAMQADLEDDAARLEFYERLADGELFLLLKSEVTGDHLDPEVLDLSGDEDLPPDQYVLAFDREDRLATFAEGPAPYAALPGRVIAAMMTGSGLGLGVNLGAPSSILIPPAAVDWLAETLGPTPEEVEGQVQSLSAPIDLPERLLKSFSEKLVTAAGIADHATLVRATYDDGSTGLVLAFADCVDGAQPALARAAQEAMTFSGTETRLDVGFFVTGDEALARIDRVGIRFDIPKPTPTESPVRKAPGSDPDKPPILK